MKGITGFRDTRHLICSTTMNLCRDQVAKKKNGTNRESPEYFREDDDVNTQTHA
jgi:hypothetical protein